MNKGDKVSVMQHNFYFDGTIVKRIGIDNTIDYRCVDGDGYYVQVEYNTTPNPNGISRWVIPFKTSDIVNWTKHIKRDEVISDLLNNG